MEKLIKVIDAIEELDVEAMNLARERQNQLTKPPGSLGVLEELSVRIAGITSNPRPRLGKKTVIIMASDHGVAAEGVSAYPSEVTPQMVTNFIAGGAAINVLARHVGVEVRIVDIGVAADIDDPKVISRKVGLGTKNVTREAAMSRNEALACITHGIEIAEDAIRDGSTILATGDMGIGNTTTSTAVLAALTDLEIGKITGRGTGVDDRRYRIKQNAIKKALEVNKPDKNDPVDVLAKVGGYEIGGLTGVILAAAKNRIPVVIDGFISGAAALLAARLAPRSANYMIASHVSVEPGHRLILQEIGLAPMLHMDMRLGEGTGAVLAMNLIDAACKILNEMVTFSEAGVSEKEETTTV